MSAIYDDDPKFGQLSDRQLDALLPDEEPEPDPRDFLALDPTSFEQPEAA